MLIMEVKILQTYPKTAYLTTTSMKKRNEETTYFVALSIQYAFKDLVSLAASINSVQTDFIFSVTIHFNMGNE